MRSGMPAEFTPHTNGFGDNLKMSAYDNTSQTPGGFLIRRRTGSSSLEEDGLSTRDGGSVVIGIIMVDDRGVGKTLLSAEGRPLVLGSVLLDRRTPLDTVSTEELRKIIASQVPSLPGNFSFLSKDGWPILQEQEKLLRIDQVVTDKNAIVIRKQFEKTRAGVVTSSGDCLGFIFTEINSSLRQVRETIDEQLKDDKPLKTEYRFTERHGWPVTRQQEGVLMVADVLVNCNLQIHLMASSSAAVLPGSTPYTCAVVPPRIRRPSPAGATLSLPLRNQNEDVPDRVSWAIEEGRKKSKKRISLRFDSRSKQQDVIELRSKQNLVAKPILISYVRAEAAEHALSVKEELRRLGFSVYLDVHEIKTGSDWQDALNFAVSHCDLFVPLITPMYGKTQWTNREVKLADVLHKFIIPINFTDQWPPECLAIQFASTQYIPWKIMDGDHAVKRTDLEKHSDYRVWDQGHIKKVSSEIANRFKIMCTSNPNANCPVGFETQYQTGNNRRTFRSNRLTSEPDEYMSIKEMDGPRHLVVISAHPRQLLFADRLKNMLEELKYEVWCSTDLMEENLDVESIGGFNSGLMINSGGLTPIPEGETLRSRKGIMVPQQTAMELIKLPLSRTDSYALSEKKKLVRLSSQLSTTSMVADSLSPGKIAQLKKFQQKAEVAGVAIIVVSEDYTKSTTSQQQVFYCEHRLQSVLVKMDNSPVPTLFSQLMGNDMLTNVDSPQFECQLKAQIKRALDPASAETPKDANMESKMQYLVKFMKKNLPMIDSCVYISGSSKLQNSRSEEICKEIGKALASVSNLNVVTGGFYGAGDIVARAFEEGLIEYPRAQQSSMEETGPIVHILPFKDQRDFKNKALQNEEGIFEPVPYGKNLFVGDSVKEREAVVARLFDICIVVEGGPGAAHEVEEFIWNDHYVIPIISTGGAAGGQFGVPLKILETPPCVNETDWSVLSEKEATPKEVAQAVTRIVVALKQAILTHITVKLAQGKQEKMAAAKAAKANKKRSKRSKKVAQQHQQDDRMYNHLTQSNESGINTKSISLEARDLLVGGGNGDYDKSSDVSCMGHSGTKWHKFMTYFRPARLASKQ